MAGLFAKGISFGNASVFAAHGLKTSLHEAVLCLANRAR